MAMACTTHGEEKEQQKRVARCACSRAEPAVGFADWPESSRAWALLYKERPARLLLLLIFFFLLRGWQTQQKSVSGRVGGAGGVSAAWMPRLSPQGRVHGVPASPTHPASSQETGFPRSSQTNHEGLRRWLETPDSLVGS